MDSFNKAIAQINDLFRSMSPGGRLTAGLLLVVAVVSVGYLFQQQTGGGDEFLFGGESIPTPTLQKMEEAFGKANLNGFALEGSRMKVPHAQRAAYLAALADAKALPPNFGEKFQKAVESNPFDSKVVREQKIKLSLQEELSDIISKMKGIESAQVLIDSQQQNGFSATLLKTATVVAKGIGALPLDDEQVDTIRHVLVGAVAGMKPENVTVADSNGPVHTGADAEHGGSGESLFLKATREQERELNNKIQKALVRIPNINVATSVTLDPERFRRMYEIKNDPKPVPLRTSESSENSTRDSSTPGGAPGLQSQGGANQQIALGAAASSKGPNETSERTKNELVNVVSQTSTEKESVGLTPKIATASIGIPSSYYEKVWIARNPAKEGEEQKKPDQAAIDPIREEIVKDVRAQVAPLLPQTTDVQDRTALVTVTTFQDIKGPEIVAPAVAQKAFSWFSQNWTMVAMVGLVLFTLSTLRSMVRSVPASEATPLSMRVSSEEGNKEEKADEVPEVAAVRRLRRMTGSGPSLRDELSDLVKEDPDSAANVLRAWIGQVN